MEQQLVACIRDNLEQYLYGNACFLGERLVAAFPSQANLRLLATCYFRSDQAYRAHRLLVGNASDPESRYLLAQCCLQLGELTQAEEALKADPQTSVPNGAAGHYLLGRICRLRSRHREAEKHFAAAVDMDPMLWVAYEELCLLGADAAERVYQADEGGAASPMGQPASSPSPPTCLPASSQMLQADRGSAMAMPSENPFGGIGGSHFNPQELFGAGSSTPSPTMAQAFVTPSPTGQLLASPAPPPRYNGRLPSAAHHGSAGGGLANGLRTEGTHVQHATTHLGMGSQGGARRGPGAPHGLPPAPGAISRDGGGGAQRWKFMDEGKLRKVSGRLFADPPSTLSRRSTRASPAPDEAPAQRNAHGAGGRRMEGGAGPVSPPEPQGARSLDGEAAVLGLLRPLGQGLRLLCLYRCKEAVAALEGLGAAQYATGWVQCCLGRAHFEMVDYVQAARHFQWARQADPTRLEARPGMEVFSTVLWHLKAEADLAALARDCLALDRRAPAAWVAAGNALSLQKEHEAALRFFMRAVQLDPGFAYAYTLAGHEYFANEDWDKGLECFRHAMRLDPRHYNAWYGVGQIYFRKENYDLAEVHFRHSLRINPHSSVLKCYLGIALIKLLRYQEALDCLNRAIALDPANPLAKFERANVLEKMERLPEALAELEALKGLAPREAGVWFAAGKLLKRLERRDEALAHFCIALDLKPGSGDAALVKAAIDRIRIADADDEEEI